MSQTRARTSSEQYDGTASNWPYDVAPVDTGGEIPPEFQSNGYEFKFQAENGDVYAGTYPRAMIENATRRPDQPYWFGVDSNGKEASLLDQELFRHLLVTGYTGTGKSTFMQTLANQIARKDHGFAAIDPGGEVTFDLIRSIPEHRLEDVIYVDPTATYLPKRVSFNFLETYHEPGEPGFEQEVRSKVSDIAPMLDAKYPRMKGVAEHIVQTLIEASHQEDYQYTILDMYWFLQGEEEREEFAEHVRAEKVNPLLEPYLDQIKDLGNDELEPLLRRLRSWISNDLVRPLICERDPEISIAEAIEEGKIILVKCDADPELRRMVTMTVARSIWSTVTARPMPDERALMERLGAVNSDSEEASRQGFDPFFLLVDEAHSVLHENMAIESMLAEARKRKLGIVLLTQQLHQIDEDLREAIQGNTGKVAFNPGDSGNEKHAVAEGFSGVERDDLDIDSYRAWMVPVNEGGQSHDPFICDMIPPYPPIRDQDAMADVIQWSVDHYGTVPRTAEEVRDDIRFGGGSTSDDKELDSAVREARELARQTLYESIYAVQIKRDSLDEAVPVDAILDEWERRADALGLTQMLDETSVSIQANALERLPGVEREPRDGQVMAWLTQEGFEDAGLAQDTGTSASGGSHAHRMVLTQAFRAFTKLDLFVSLPTQEGESLPDGVAKLPIDPMDAKNLPAVHRKERRLREEYPALYELTDGRHVSIEAETSTPTAPEQMLTNLRKAVTKGDLCVFATKDASASKGAFDYWPRRCEKVLYDTYREKSETKIDDSRLTFARTLDENDNRTFYNKKKAFFRLSEGTYALRRKQDTEIRWVEDGDEIVLRDTGDRELGRFDGPAAVADPSPADVKAYYEYDQGEGEYVVYAEGEKSYYGSSDELEAEWSRIQAPFIPENEFVDEAGTLSLPTEDDWVFVIFPDADNDEYDQPQLYEGGEVRPLLGVGMGKCTTQATAGDANNARTSLAATNAQNTATAETDARKPLQSHSTDPPEDSSSSDQENSDDNGDDGGEEFEYLF